LGGTRAVLAWLHRREILDHPNERSSHKAPTPRGGGLAVTPAVLLAWLAAAEAGWVWVAVLGAALLMLTSWADDRHDLPPGPRLLAHAGVVAGALMVMAPEQLVFQGWLPLWADRMVAGLGWLWFVNLYNFMDGIDGITGVETTAIGGGAALVAVLSGVAGVVPLGLACAAAALGFLVWNWHPARIFLGDVGSVPLGFLLGGLLVQLAANGQLAAALILPAYYLADATITLGRRAVRGEKVWRPHRQHFYQRALAGADGHDKVVLAILAADAVLVALAALAALGHDLGASVAAVATVAILLGVLARWGRAPEKRFEHA
jgi:UDP-N-acetylmuramyl pentapeptide phosphotransferase/UDP-N-acetylglucosamine-1-phosphate transferase